MTKLLNNETKKYDEIPGSEVNAAIDSGLYNFGSTRNVPIAQNGAAVWVDPSDASKYRKGLTFLSDEDVLKGNATERFRGIGGTLAGLAYGAADTASLGLVPLAVEAMGGQAGKDFHRDITLGAPTATTIGGIGGLFVDPFAAGAKLLGKGAVKGVGLAAEHAGGSLAAREIETATREMPLLGSGPRTAPKPGPGLAAAPAAAGKDVVSKETAVPRLGPGPERVASGEADLSLGRRLRDENAAARADESLPQRLLPERKIEAPESRLTLSRPPFESELMTDIQNSRANTNDRLREVETLLSGKRVKGKKALLVEREELQGHLDEYEFMDMKFAAAEEAALAEQAGRADAARRFGEPSLATGEIRTAEAGHADLELAAQQAEQSRARNRMGQGAPDIIGRPATDQGVGAGRELVLGQKRPGLADVLGAESKMAAEGESMAAWNARNAETAVAEDLAWRKAGGTRAATQVESDIAAAEGVTPGRELANVPHQNTGLATAAYGGAPVAAEAEKAAGPGLALGMPSSKELSDGAKNTLSMMGQGAIYGGASQLSREQAGLEEGAPGSVLKAAALGGAIPLALGLGGRALGGAAKAAGSALSASERFQKFAGGIEETHLLRMADFGVTDVQKINRGFTTPLTGEQGTRKFADFMKDVFNHVDDIKNNPANAGNKLLQEIPSDGGAALWNMTPQRTTALADATVKAYSGEYKLLYDVVGHEPVALSTLQKIADDVRGTQAKMAPTTSMKSVQSELDEFENAIARATPDPVTGKAQQTFTINDLQDTRTRFGEAFSNAQAGAAWTKQQAEFYTGIRNGVVDAAESVSPGMRAAFDRLDPLYTMAKVFQEGAASAAAKKATQSPISRDLLTKVALGIAAVGTPVGALGFLGVSIGLRHAYAQRGEGFIAAMAGKAAGPSFMGNPAGAAQFTGRSILNAKRPMMLGYNAEKFVETTPKEYTEIVAAVHQLQATRDKARADVMSAIQDLTPDQQKQTADNVDLVLNQIIKMLPTGLSPDKELTQQEKNYTIFVKSILDPTRFGTQVIVNGGPGVDAAKAALGASPQGQQFLIELHKTLNDAVQSNELLRSQKMLPGTVKQIVTLLRAKSHSSLGTIHGQGPEAEGPSSPVAPSAATGAKNAFARNAGLSSGINIG